MPALHFSFHTVFDYIFQAYFLSSQRHQPYQSQDRPYQSRDQPFRNWEYEEDDDYNSSESVSYAYDDMLAYRKILNVGHDAGQKEIERAFRDRAFVLHPGLLDLMSALFKLKPY